MRRVRAKELRRLAAATAGADGNRQLAKRTVTKQQTYQGKLRRWLCDIVFHPPGSYRRVYQDLDDASGESCLSLKQDDVSEGFIDFVGSDRGFVITKRRYVRAGKAERVKMLGLLRDMAVAVTKKNTEGARA